MSGRVAGWSLLVLLLGMAQPVLAVDAPPVNEEPEEIVELRSRFARQYQGNNGQRLAEISTVPLHFRDPGSEWKPIGLELETEAGSGDQVANDNTLKVRSNDEGIAVTDASGNGVRWLTPEEPEKDDASSLTFGRDDVTWRYELTPFGLKAGALVVSARGLHTYAFPAKNAAQARDSQTDIAAEQAGLDAATQPGTCDEGCAAAIL